MMTNSVQQQISSAQPTSFPWDMLVVSLLSWLVGGCFWWWGSAATILALRVMFMGYAAIYGVAGLIVLLVARFPDSAIARWPDEPRRE